jgi:hypothetical protein
VTAAIFQARHIDLEVDHTDERKVRVGLGARP